MTSIETTSKCNATATITNKSTDLLISSNLTQSYSWG